MKRIDSPLDSPDPDMDQAIRDVLQRYEEVQRSIRREQAKERVKRIYGPFSRLHRLWHRIMMSIDPP